MKKIINLPEDFVKEMDLAGAYGKKENKTLVARVHFDSRIVDFVVYNGINVVSEHDYLKDAVESYNNI